MISMVPLFQHTTHVNLNVLIEYYYELSMRTYFKTRCAFARTVLRDVKCLTYYVLPVRPELIPICLRPTPMLSPAASHRRHSPHFPPPRPLHY